jgi:hypothetical protein
MAGVSLVSERQMDSRVELALLFCVLYLLCVMWPLLFACFVLFERGVILCDTCIFVFYLIVVPLRPVKDLFAVQLNNNKNMYTEHTEGTDC